MGSLGSPWMRPYKATYNITAVLLFCGLLKSASKLPNGCACVLIIERFSDLNLSSCSFIFFYRLFPYNNLIGKLRENVSFSQYNCKINKSGAKTCRNTFTHHVIVSV